MATYRHLLAAFSIAGLVVGLSACSKPAPAVEPSDAAASAASAASSPSSEVDVMPPPSDPSSATDRPGPQAQNGCYQVVTGGGFIAGVNGGPGIVTPGQTRTICPPPPLHIDPPPVAVPTPAPAVAPAPARAQPATPDTN
jgi:hypothetical protein